MDPHSNASKATQPCTITQGLIAKHGTVTRIKADGSETTFKVGIVPLNAHKSEQVMQESEKLYQALQRAGVSVYLDDRDKKTSPGVKFKDME